MANFLCFLLLCRIGKRRVRHYLIPFRSGFFVNFLDLSFLIITSKNAPTPKTEFISDLVFIDLSFHARY